MKHIYWTLIKQTLSIQVRACFINIARKQQKIRDNVRNGANSFFKKTTPKTSQKYHNLAFFLGKSVYSVTNEFSHVLYTVLEEFVKHV